MFDPTANNLDLITAEVAYRHTRDVPPEHRPHRRHRFALREKSVAMSARRAKMGRCPAP